jgi:ATP-dependent protease HslVU (ClpYQ) peptidase subunit
MTCIVAIVENGEVHIGGDSAGVGGYSITVRADRKVFRNGPFVMGFTTSFRMGQLLAHSLKAPRRHPEDDVYAFMVTDFINAVRTCLKDGGYASKENETEAGGTFLVGYAGRLFTIYDDYQVGESVDGYVAVGCGQDLALGSLHSTVGQAPADRVRIALEAAEHFSAGVCGPFHMEKLAA